MFGLKKEYVEDQYEEVVLKMLICSNPSCGSGYTISDSRDQDRINRMSLEEKEAHEKRKQELLNLIDSTCKCGKGTLEYDVKEWEERYKGYTIVHCTCGRKVECHNFTNTCDCGNDFNWNGDLLADRSQWGEETGERWSDCY